MSYFDIVIIVLVVLFALLGLWRGFFKSIISFFGWTVSFLIAFFLTKPMANALLDIARVRHFVLGTSGKWSIFTWIQGKLAADQVGFMNVLLKPLIKTCEKAGVDSEIGVPLMLANGMFSAMLCLVMFAVFRLLMLLFTLFANAMTKDKPKNALSRFLGFVIGLAQGGSVVCYIMVFFSFIMGLSFMAPAREQLDKSVIAQPVYQMVVKATDKFFAGNADTLTKLMHHYGLESGSKQPAPEAPAYCGTYTGDTSMGEYDDIITTYSLELKADGTFTLVISQNTAAETTTHTGTYEWNAEEGKLTLHVTGAEESEEYDLLPDGSIYYDGVTLRKPGTGGEEPGTGGEEPGTGGEEPGTGGEEPGTGGEEPGTGGEEPGTGGEEPGGEEPEVPGGEGNEDLETGGGAGEDLDAGVDEAA